MKNSAIISGAACVIAACQVCTGEPAAAPRVRVIWDNGNAILERNGIPEFQIIEGDMLVPLGNVAATFETNLWDNGIVRYEFSGNVPQWRRNYMLSAMATMESISGIQFVEGKSILDSGITIESTHPSDCSGCDCVNNATVGETFFGHMNICNWDSNATLLHELGHVLNLRHEQARPDRDEYVRINFDNIPQNQKHNFKTAEDAWIYGPYDFTSLMHYHQCAFAGNLCPGCPNDSSCVDGGRTIVLLPPNDVVWQSSVGTTGTLSYLDRTTIAFLYPKANWRFVDQGVCEFCDIYNCFGNGS